MTAIAASDGLAPDVRESGYWRDAWHTLSRDWTAMLGAAIVVALVLAALLAPLVAPHDPADQLREGLTDDGSPIGPSGAFLFGTDPLGRDELSRILSGARVSLAVGVGANLLAAVFAIAVGGTAGMAGRLLQTLLMRLADIILSFPILLLAIALLAVANPNLLSIVLIVGIGFGAYLARIVFAQVVSLREREFITAARSAGVGSTWILIRHVIPHVLPSILVFVALGIATAIQLEAALSYVGIGIRPPEASWGNMINEGQQYLRTSPWLVAFPGGAIMLTMLGFGLLGDGLRDALDPSLERRTRLLGFGIR